ncbi:MAG: 7-carboxy-7-deazaguanine synthase, partial [Ignavibacteria bacterium RBG_13_36_8]
DEGYDTSIASILQEIKKYKCKLVEVTGGEPLVQKESQDLLTKLCDEGYEVLLETSGSLSIVDVDRRVKIIMDFKCPSSGMVEKNLFENVYHLKSTDEVKFVIGDKEDYSWAKNFIEKYDLIEKCEVLFSPVFNKIELLTLVNWILQDSLNVRFQFQIHKYIWKPETKGV